MENFWDYSVWGGLNLFAVLLISLLAANLMKKFFPVLKASLIPSSVLGGGILIVVASIYKFFSGNVMFDTLFFGGNGTANLELITYHALALGFIASALKSSKGPNREHTSQSPLFQWMMSAPFIPSCQSQRPRRVYFAKRQLSSGCHTSNSSDRRSATGVP